MNKHLDKHLWVISGVVLIVLGCLESYLVNSITLIGVLLIGFLLINGVRGYLFQKEEKSLKVFTTACSSLAILFEIVWFITHWYPAFVMAQLLVIVAGFYCFYAAWRLSRSLNLSHNYSPVLKYTFRIFRFAGIGIAALVSLAMITVSVTPVPLIKGIQSINAVENSYNPLADTQDTVMDSGHLLINDIQYATEYPRSYLDVYISDNDKSVVRPTYFLVHGGGFILGDKQMGDPNADGGGNDFYIKDMLDAGYNVVAINYAFAPEYKFPIPVIQLSQAVEFMMKHGNEYGIDMSQVVLSGGSAGGNIVGNFANIQTNPAYAEKMGILPVISHENIIAVVLDSAAIDPERGGKTQIPVASLDFQFYQAMRAYFNKATLMEDNDTELANITNNATEEFPPTFIADGNTGTFPDQAEDLAARLNHLGVTNYLNLYDVNEVSLGHGFMASSSDYTTDYTNKKLAFLKSLSK